MKKDGFNTFAYKVGYIFATTIALCITAAVVGITIKFLMWLF